jgi:hypothetical protein
MLVLLSTHSEGLQHIRGAWRRKTQTPHSPLDGLATLFLLLGRGRGIPQWRANT